MKKNIKSLLSINLEAQLSLAKFLDYTDHRDDVVKREIFNYELGEEFNGFFDGLRIICFNEKLAHLVYSGNSRKELQPLDEMVKKIYDEFGPDENGYGANGIRGQNFLSWYFANSEHDILSDAHEVEGPSLYYGLLFSRIRREIEFTILKYANLIDRTFTSEQLKRMGGG